MPKIKQQVNQQDINYLLGYTEDGMHWIYKYFTYFYKLRGEATNLTAQNKDNKSFRLFAKRFELISISDVLNHYIEPEDVRLVRPSVRLSKESHD